MSLGRRWKTLQSSNVCLSKHLSLLRILTIFDPVAGCTSPKIFWEMMGLGNAFSTMDVFQFLLFRNGKWCFHHGWFPSFPGCFPKWLERWMFWVSLNFTGPLRIGNRLETGFSISSTASWFVWVETTVVKQIPKSTLLITNDHMMKSYK